MRLLQRKFEVETRYGGGFVQKIDGVGGGRRSGRPVDWFFYVNGIEAETAPRRGGSRPATACGGTTTTGAPRCASRRSSAPSPSRSCRASKGKRVPVRIDCGASVQACVPRGAEAARGRRREGRRRVDDRLAGGGGRAARARRALGRGPRATRPRAGSRAGRRSPASTRCRLPGATGSSCSTRAARPCARSARAPASWPRRASSTRQPTWVVAGTDAVGVDAAAAAAGRDPAARPLRGRDRERPRDPVPLPAGAAP